MSAETITSEYLFIVPCKICNEEVGCSDTKEIFDKRINSNITTYGRFNKAENKMQIVGFSRGTGDSFECAACAFTDGLLKIYFEQT